MEKFQFDKDFQTNLIALMFQKWDFLVTVADLLKPEYFEGKILVWFFQRIVEYYKDHNKKPDEIVLKNEFNKAYKSHIFSDDEIKAVADVFNCLKTPVLSDTYIQEEVLRFCRRQSVRAEIMNAVSMTNSDDPEIWDQISNNMFKACTVGKDVLDMGIRHIGDTNERVRRRLSVDERKIIPTRVGDLDNYIGGGPKSGQLMLWLAGSGHGKSICLVHCGKVAVCSGYKVVHYTLELSAEDVCDRYDSNWTKIPIYDLANKSEEIIGKMDALGKKYGDSLYVKEYPTKSVTVLGIKSHIQRLKNSGFHPDLIIVDYLDLLKPTTKYNDEYSDLGSISAELRGLAMEFKVPVQSATQVNRAGLVANVLEMTHISDSLQKIFIADIVAGICMTREERDAKIARIVGIKNRNGPVNFEVPIHTAYERMCFYDVMAQKSVEVKPDEILKGRN
jgi:replicative DNA helicase